MIPVAEFPNLLPALTESFLAVAAMALLMVGTFVKGNPTRLVGWLAVGTFIVAAAILLVVGGERVVTFNGMFVLDRFAWFVKLLILLASALVLVMSFDYIAREQMDRFEFPVIIVLATLGMCMMVSANDLISLYVGLEMQSLALYVAAAFKRDFAKSSEAGLKYFVLGALSSGLLLYGASMVYGFAGTTSFDRLAAVLLDGETVSPGLIAGIVFVAAGLAFKLSAVPFHMWTPDVYEGAPTPVTAFFAAAPKLAAIALFIRLLIEPFGELVDQWRQIVWFIAAASMILGALAAIVQRNIKRLMAYSSIGHVGYALVGLAAGSEQGVQGVLVYMAIYVIMTLGTFAVILSMRQNGRMVEEISDLSGLSRTSPMMALATGIFMFSMAGIPPLAGFFGKLYVFLAAIEAELHALAILGVLTSVVSAYYYLRIVKIMCFDEPSEAFDRPYGVGLSAVMAGTGVVTLLFFVFPGPIINGAAAAAAALFAG